MSIRINHRESVKCFVHEAHPFLNVFLTLLGLNLTRRNPVNGLHEKAILGYVPAIILLIYYVLVLIISILLWNIVRFMSYTVTFMLLVQIINYAQIFFVIAISHTVRKIKEEYLDKLGPTFRKNQDRFRLLLESLIWMAYVAILFQIYHQIGLELHGMQLVNLILIIVSFFLTPLLIDYQFLILMRPLTRHKCRIKEIMRHAADASDQYQEILREVNHQQELTSMFDKVRVPLLVNC